MKKHAAKKPEEKKSAESPNEKIARESVDIGPLRMSVETLSTEELLEQLGNSACANRVVAENQSLDDYLKKINNP